MSYDSHPIRPRQPAGHRVWAARHGRRVGRGPISGGETAMPTLYVPPDEPADWPSLLDPMLQILEQALAATARRERLLADAPGGEGGPEGPWRQALERCGGRLAEWHRHV